MPESAVVPLEKTFDTDCMTTSGRFFVSFEGAALVSARDIFSLICRRDAVRRQTAADLAWEAYFFSANPVPLHTNFVVKALV